jgi:hypothetical protein
MSKQTEKIIHFKATPKNTGPVTINRRKVAQLVHPNGEPVRGGDLKVGQAFDVDLDTGIIKPHHED